MTDLTTDHDPAVSPIARKAVEVREAAAGLLAVDPTRGDNRAELERLERGVAGIEAIGATALQIIELNQVDRSNEVQFGIIPRAREATRRAMVMLTMDRSLRTYG